jgi:hypothetical protein
MTITTTYTVIGSTEFATGIDILVLRNAQGERLGQVRHPGGLHLGSDVESVLAAIGGMLPRRPWIVDHCGRLMYVTAAAD